MKFKISLVDNRVEEQLGMNIIDADSAQTLVRTCFDRITTKKVGINADGSPKLMYNTGFLPEPIQKNRYLKDQSEELLKKQKNDEKRLLEHFGKDKESISPFNSFTWEEYGTIEINNGEANNIYDTENIRHMILYWQIMCTAFDEIATCLDEAYLRGCLYYIDTVEGADSRSSEVENLKVKAHGKLGHYSDNKSIDVLLYLCWFLGDKDNYLMGFNKSTSISTIVRDLYNFIEGKSNNRDKKKTVQLFLDACALYEGNNDKFMATTMIKSADYHNLLKKTREGVYMFKGSVELGKNLEECVENIQKPFHTDTYKELSDEVLNLFNNVIDR